MHARPAVRLMLVAALLLGVLPAPAVHAGPFSRTTVISGTYLMGTSTLSEYDGYVAMYPGIDTGFAFTFYRNGTVDVQDEQDGQVEHGTYSRFNNNRRIRVTLTSTQSPWGVVTYELYRVANTNEWWGEVRIGGDVWGHFRGDVQ